MLEVQPGVPVYRGHPCGLEMVSKCILEMKDESSVVFLLSVKHGLCELGVNTH